MIDIGLSMKGKKSNICSVADRHTISLVTWLRRIFGRREDEMDGSLAIHGKVHPTQGTTDINTTRVRRVFRWNGQQFVPEIPHQEPREIKIEAYDQ